MSALQMLSFHQLNPNEPHDGWWECRCGEAFSPEHVLATLKAAGYAVVELPKPVVGQDWDWCVVLPQHWRDGVMIDDLVSESGLLTIDEARSKAGALLAAADAAEAAS